MKPKTQEHHRIIAISNSLAPMSKEMRADAFNQLFVSYSYATKNGEPVCMTCGKKVAHKSCKCKIDKHEVTRKTVYSDYDYYAAFEYHGDYQIIRHWYCSIYTKKGQKQKQHVVEVHRLFINVETGKVTEVSKLKGMMFNYNDQWIWSSDLEIRNSYTRFSLKPYWKQLRIHPKLKRNGLGRSFHGIAPSDIIINLSSPIPQLETLWKAKQYQLFAHFATPTRNLKENEYTVLRINNLWAPIKIAIRNGYKVKDAQQWVDYIRLARMLNLDVHNAHYTCPKDLHAEHQKLLARKARIDKQMEQQRRIERIAKEDKIFQEKKAEILQKVGVIQTGTWMIKPLASVMEYYEEGEVMNHCIFTNEYFKNKDSICLTALREGEKIATVELDIKTFTVKKCRGIGNAPSKYNAVIRKLIKSNLRAKLIRAN